MSLRSLFIGVALIALMGAEGVFLWWLLRTPSSPVAIEPAAPSIRQTDGSLVLPRQQTTPRTKPKALLPEKGKLERQVEVQVQPSRPIEQKDVGAPPPPVTVDLSLVGMPDRSRRVVASSPDGAIVGGIDVPVLPLEQPRVWSAGVSLGTFGERGVWVERDVGRVRLGAEVSRDGRGVARAQLRLGWNF